MRNERMINKGNNWVGLCFMALLILVLPFQCVEPFTPTLEENESLLVVEGIITDAPGPYIVELSISTDLTSLSKLPLAGARVTIVEQGGEQEELLEISPGVYSTSVSGIRGVVGKRYKVVVVTPEGEAYESSFEEILPPEPVDTVYVEIESRVDPNYNYDLRGYQFYVDASIQNPENKYLFWKLTATYKFNADLKIPFYYAGGIFPFPNPDSLFTCFKTIDVRDVFVFNAEKLTDPEIRQFPLHFVDTEYRELYLRYSLLTKQYTISKEAFLFWDNIKKQNSDLGALYTTQPFQIRGNVMNVSDQEEPVLGYFMAAGYSENRIFVDRPFGVPFHFSNCVIGEPEIYDMRSLPWLSSSLWPIFLGESPEGAIGLPSQNCVDCRLKGATIEKPDFWID